MSQTPDRLQSEIFKRKPYLQNYFVLSDDDSSDLQLLPTKIQKLNSLESLSASSETTEFAGSENANLGDDYVSLDRDKDSDHDVSSVDYVTLDEGENSNPNVNTVDYVTLDTNKDSILDADANLNYVSLENDMNSNPELIRVDYVSLTTDEDKNSNPDGDSENHVSFETDQRSENIPDFTKSENIESEIPKEDIASIQSKSNRKLEYSNDRGANSTPLSKSIIQEEFENKILCNYVTKNQVNLASSYDSYTQAQRNFDTSSPSDRDLVILLGLGNPEIIRYSNSKIPPNQVIIAIDDSEKIVPLLWNQYLQEFAKVPGRHIFCGESFISLLWNYFDGLPIERISGVKIIRNKSSIDSNPNFYHHVEERILATFSAKMSDLLTKFEFETLWTSNILRNTIRYFHSGNNFLISDFRDKLQSIPALLVSAGPSLRKNLEFIHKFRDKFFIMSCDTSLKVLLKYNIIPDGIYTLDAQMNSIFHFLGEDIRKVPLFADMVSAPYLLDTIKPRSVVFSMTAKYTNDAAGNLNREVTAGGEFAQDWIGDIGDIQSGGSVATTAFDALRFMGCKEIFFIGQDLAYTGREIHSTGTHHNEKWLGLINRKNSLERINEIIVRKRDTRYVDSINGSQVLTDYVLDLYRSWFEESASSLANMRLINIGLNGANISGMENMQSHEAEVILATKQSHNYPWRNWKPWIDQSSKDAQPTHIKKSDRQDPANVIYDDILDLLNKVKIWKNSENYNVEIESWFKSRLYLRRLYRKTEVYLLRHRDQLDSIRKRKLTLDTIEREFKKLKRKIYPMMNPDFFSKNNRSSS
ncbi:6-hydroxymethylpterin diphosphokinase MptE-like protein [Leptospira sp. GIMC2001]|uniref:6-hydroxymethylpterin diphosphokinase MptE-like protein n=1 Tax=Leptospira sp. GIMC2001 TaxID=1513297 RepID=UPI00234BB864|nr:6-hydroxymethylpterin diphosphokinase MptE-like protein [Leptospira sp. GIMC2001]WCL48376.1 DUF115 domain-containing protein [Leptospira sp. GIMC2001]